MFTEGFEQYADQVLKDVQSSATNDAVRERKEGVYHGLKMAAILLNLELTVMDGKHHLKERRE